MAQQGVTETYLGDAVFASHDGWMIRLRTGDGGNQVIYLEPRVYSALVAYVDSLKTPTPASAPTPPPFNPDDTTQEPA